MISIRKIRTRFGGPICRRCINKEYHYHLTRKDCRYGDVILCPCCREEHHAVIGLKISGRLKTLIR